MKTLGKFWMICLIAGITTSASLAQGPRGGNMDPEERIKKQTAELTELLTLDEDQQVLVEALLTATGDKMKALRQNTTDRQGMRDQMNKINDEQTASMKEILTEEQFTLYEEYLEKRREELMKRRGQRGNKPGRK